MSTFARGKAFEQIVAGMIRRKLDATAKRDTRSGANWHRRSDISTALPLHLELKDHATLKPKEWYRQASGAASMGQTPIVVFRSDEEVMAMLRFDDVLDLFVEIADLKAELKDLREPGHVTIQPPKIAKTAEEAAEQVRRIAKDYDERLCPSGHLADDYGKCQVKDCKFRRGYVAPKAKKEVRKV
jgi:hypothetical protein